MPAVLVPLNETAFAESILPDAEELAGPGGRIVLAFVAPSSEQASDAERYLSNEAQLLQSKGFQATTKVLTGADIPRAIDEGVKELGAEMVAAATHGAERGGRLTRSSIAWKTLAHSPVPILLRHSQEGQVRELDEPAPRQFTIMVPLDGSQRAEHALSVATDLATQWQGSLLLAQIGPDGTGGQAYLDRMAGQLKVTVQTVIGEGKPGEELARLAGEKAVTHVVMTSHGRTGLSRVIAGDIAAQLIDRLSLPIIVVPVLAAVAQPEQRSSQEGSSRPADVPATHNV